MEQYFKIVEEGYISLVGTGSSDNAITRAEYETILSVIHNRPAAQPGYTYKLRTDLTWELREAPPAPEEDPEATEEDYLAALAELGVSVNA